MKKALTPRNGAVDMTSGPILKQLLVFGAPIFLGSVFQQLYSMVDSIVVGNYVGSDALASVGSASVISNCLVMVATGLTTGASVVVAQLAGAKQFERIRHAISTTLIFAFFVAFGATAAGLLFAPDIIRWVRVPEGLRADSVAYLRIYVGGILFLMLYNFFSAMLCALGDSKTPLIFLVIASLLNIAGDLWFVLVFRMGVPGVALATVLAQGISVILCAVHCARKVEAFRFQKGEFRFYRTLFGDILRLSVPSALQFSLASLGLVLVQGLINSFGEIPMAAYTAASKLEGVSHLPIESISMSLSVFVGQNIGAGSTKRVKTGLQRALLASAGICTVIAVLVYTLGPQLIALFVGGEDKNAEEVIRIGAAFMRIWAPLTVAFAVMNCFTSVLRGAGDAIFVMTASFADLGGRLVMAYVLAIGFQIGFMGIAYAMFSGWLLSLIISVLRYVSGRWKNKAISAISASAAQQ